MVVVIVLSALVVAVVWVHKDFERKFHKEQADLLREAYHSEQDWRIDLQIKLKDSQETVSRLICENAMRWAALEAKDGKNG